MIRMTCPCCGTRFPWEAGLIEDDAKRLAEVAGSMEPATAKAAMSYLRLFKPPKSALRIPRATKLLQEVADLVAAGTVCRDERTAMRRPAPPAVWIDGIEKMLQQANSLTLPLTSHGYLREVVYTLADKAEASAEREHERRLRERPRTAATGPTTVVAESRLQNQLAYLSQMLHYEKISQGEHDRQAQEARDKYGAQQ